MRADRRAFVVVDLGFGDAGKGLVTDALVRAFGAHTVVRFNGGAQAGHNVVTPEGRHHTFAQLGAGTFVPGVRTHLSRFVVVHPTALAVEAARLAEVGVSDALARLTIARDALVITPFHQAACRIRELARGDARHGSCGVGVGEAVADALSGDALRMKDLSDRVALRSRLARIRERKRAELASTLSASDEARSREARVLADDTILEAWIERVRALASRVAIVDDERAMTAILQANGGVVFEGAQGVLLDEHRGFHPHTTWSTCTPANALTLIGAHDVERTTIGVLRTYATRHGAGPFPTEDPELTRMLPDAHNVDGPWQGPLRAGWPDLVLSRYALEVSGSVDALAITHVDALSRRDRWRVARGYAGDGGALFDREGEVLARVRPSAEVDLDHQAALGRALAEVEPIYDEVDPREVPEAMASALALPIAMTSSGPSAADVRMRLR